MMQKLTLFISCLILLPMLIGFGCDGSERPGERSYDEPIGSTVSSAGFYVLKAGGGKAVSWGTSKAIDHFWGDGEANDAEAIQSSLEQIFKETEDIKDNLKDLREKLAMIEWLQRLQLIEKYTENIRTYWNEYQDIMGINRITGEPLDGNPEVQPDEDYWTEIVARKGVLNDLYGLHYFMTGSPIESAGQNLLESCVEYLLWKNDHSDRTPARMADMVAFLEQTFLELVDYQCRGFILYREAYHVLNEADAVSGKKSPEIYLEQELRPAIQRQALEFLRCAERLLIDNINLAADAGPDGTGVMEVPEHWLYAEIAPEYLRVFPDGGKEMLERATLTAVKVLSYVDDQFINMRETGEEIFIVHVIGDPKSVAQAPATYLSQYLTIPIGTTFDETLLPKNSFKTLPVEFNDGLKREDGLRIGSTQYIQFYRRKMSTLPEEFTTAGENTSENRETVKLYVGFEETDSIDSAAYRITGNRPGDWGVDSVKILDPKVGEDSIQFGHALYSARPIGSYLGFARSVQDLKLIDSNLYGNYTQKVVRTLPGFGPPVASRSMPEWSDADCNFVEGHHLCRAKWLYEFGLKAHLAYSGEESFTMNLQPAVLVDHPTSYDRLMIDAVKLDSKQKTDDGYLYTSSEIRSLDFSPSNKFKSITVELISESSGKGCHNEFKRNQQMSLQSLSIGQPQKRE